jgi:hypothetical protein
MFACGSTTDMTDLREKQGYAAATYSSNGEAAKIVAATSRVGPTAP